MAGLRRLALVAALLSACSDTAMMGAMDGAGQGMGDGSTSVDVSDAGIVVDGVSVADTDVAQDDEGPVIEVLLPAEGVTLSGLVTVQVMAKDPSGVGSLQVEVDGSILTDANPAADVVLATWDSVAATDGPHKLSARAVDALGNESWVTVPLVSYNGAGKLVAGSVSLGRPVVGATVKVYDRGVAGALGQVLGEAVTAPDGSFSLQTDRQALSEWGVVVVAGPGGQLQDPATDEMLALAADDALLAVVPLPPGDGSVIVRVHAWTTLAARLVEGLERWGTDFDEAPALAMGLVGEHLRRPTPIDLLVVEPAHPDSDSFVWPKPPALVGLSHVGLAQMAHQRSATILDATRLLAADLTDAAFDGVGSLDHGAGGPLKWPDAKPVDTEDSRYELALSIDAWAGKAWKDKNHPAGVTAATLEEAGGFLDVIATDDGPLYPNGGWMFDEDPPVVEWLAPTPAEGAWVGPSGKLGVIAKAVDKSPLTSFTLTMGSKAVEATVSGTTLSAEIDLTTWDDGPLSVVAAATDSSRGALTGTVTRLLYLDRTPPEMPAELVSPTSGGWATTSEVALTVTVTDETSGVDVVEAVPLTGCDPCDAVPLEKGAGDHWEAMLPLPTEGDNSYLLRARDVAGNVVEVPWGVKKDTVAPVVLYDGSTYVDAQELSVGSVDGDGTAVWSAPTPTTLDDLCCLGSAATCTPGKCSSEIRMLVQDIECGDFTPRVTVRVVDPALPTTTLMLRYGKIFEEETVWANEKPVALSADGTAEVELCTQDLGDELSASAGSGTHVVRFEATDQAGNVSKPFELTFELELVTPPLWVADLETGDDGWDLTSYSTLAGTLHTPFASTTGGAEGLGGHFRVAGWRIVNPHPIALSVSSFPQPVVSVSRATRRSYLKLSDEQPNCGEGLCSYLWTDATPEEEENLGLCTTPLYFVGKESWQPLGLEVRTYALPDGAEPVDVTKASKLTIPPHSEVRVVTHLLSGGTCAVKAPYAHVFGGITTPVYLASDLDDPDAPCPPMDTMPGGPPPLPVANSVASCKANAAGLKGGSFANPVVITGVRLETLAPNVPALWWSYQAAGAEMRSVGTPPIGGIVATINQLLMAPTPQWPQAAPY